MEMDEELQERLQKEYPAGTRVRLIEMEDQYAPPAGTFGTVQDVDDLCDIHVAWDNGSNLALIYGVDKFEAVENDDDIFVSSDEPGCSDCVHDEEEDQTETCYKCSWCMGENEGYPCLFKAKEES